MTAVAREPSIWDEYLVKDDNATPEEKKERLRQAGLQWERYRKVFGGYDQREADNSGHVEIRTLRLEDDPEAAGSTIEISTDIGGSE